MGPAGVASIEAAKADGRGDRAYAGPAPIEIPDDFAAGLAKDIAATSIFEVLNKKCYGVCKQLHLRTGPSDLKCL